MINTTVDRLKCPRKKRGKNACGSSLQVFSMQKKPSARLKEVFETSFGHLECQKCQARFPILAGVAIVVDDVRAYLLSHVKGISQIIEDKEIPSEYRREFLDAKAEIQAEHIEEDLEAQRVNALYLMNHYLRVQDVSAEGGVPWWSPLAGPASPIIDALIREHWDRGPFAQIEHWVGSLGKGKHPRRHAVELGCGVGGLYIRLKKHLASYLGVDSSFASIALARHLALGMPYRGSIRIPGDLLQGSLSRSVQIAGATSYDGQADFIVGDLENLPLTNAQWDLAIALNAIDMLDQPSQLPRLKYDLLKEKGTAIQSCPYIWHETVSRKLRAGLPREIRDSARAVEWLYEKAGFKVGDKVDHLPWLFYKHLRQLEIYSVHLFTAEKMISK